MHKKIGIVDDHKIVIDGIKASLLEDNEIAITFEADNGTEVLEKLNSGAIIDLLIMDISMKDINGIELSKQIKELHPQVKIIAFTMHDDIYTFKELYELNVEGYVLKHSNNEDLIAAIDTVLSGGTYYDEDLLKAFEDSKSSITDEAILSEREVEILKLIANEKSTKDIAQELFISIRTVETHRKNIIRKTGKKTLAGLINYAYKERLVS